MLHRNTHFHKKSLRRRKKRLALWIMPIESEEKNIKQLYNTGKKNKTNDNKNTLQNQYISKEINEIV